MQTDIDTEMTIINTTEEILGTLQSHQRLELMVWWRMLTSTWWKKPSTKCFNGWLEPKGKNTEPKGRMYKRYVRGKTEN